MILGQFIISNLKRSHTLLTKIVNLFFLRAYGSLPNTQGFERHFRQYGTAMELVPNLKSHLVQDF